MTWLANSASIRQLSRIWHGFAANIVDVSPRIVISVFAIIAVMVVAYMMYKRYISSLAPDEKVRQVNGARLTSENLHGLPTPPWRIVFEISEDKLSGVDHVVIGPSGVIAVTTIMADRPTAVTEPEAHQVAASAVSRSGVDELAQRAGLQCNMSAKVFWGTPHPELPAAIETMHATMAVEGQRFTEWLSTLPPGPLTPTQIDAAWQAILIGIGRPDPLT